jgi:hypothetical protein
MKPVSPWSLSLATAIPVVSSAVGPLVAYDSNIVGLSVVHNAEFEVLQALEERIPTIDLGTYPLSISLPKNDRLFTMWVSTPWRQF